MLKRLAQGGCGGVRFKVAHYPAARRLAIQRRLRHTAPSVVMFQEIKDSLRRPYLEDSRLWLVGFSGGKDSTMLAALVFDAVISVPAEQRKKPVSVLCTDTRVEIPTIAEMVEGTLDRMRKRSEQQGLNIDASLLKPTLEESFWVNIIGRGLGAALFGSA